MGESWWIMIVMTISQMRHGELCMTKHESDSAACKIIVMIGHNDNNNDNYTNDTIKIIMGNSTE